MAAAATSLAHPRAIEVPIMGGERRLLVRPWVMGQRHELRPRLEALISRYVSWQGAPQDFDLGALFIEFEEECAAIAEITVRAQLTEMNVTWDDLAYEDLPSIVQAIWETSIVRPGGGGLAGKLMGVLGPALLALARGAVTSEPSPTTPTPTPSPKQRSLDLDSLPDDGAPTQSGSAGL